MVAVTSIASIFSGLLVTRRLGELADRWGPRRLQLISAALIPILPLAWMVASSPWHIIFVNILAGILWGAYNLASFNFLLLSMPVEGRPRFSALYQVVVMLSLAAGAAAGGLVVTQWGYPAIFVLSALGRVIAVALFARFVPSPPPALQPATKSLSP
jgi:predicted MFS family arabinose efflux permease